jgi:Domain of unknown function (DUF4396)
MAPGWLDVIAWVSLAVCLACASTILIDIFVRGRRQSMGVMEAVFPITALYFGPLALRHYLRWERAPTRPAGESHAMRDGDDRADTPSRPRWVTYAIETSHCGAGCVLGDLISEWVIYAFALSVAGHTLFAEYIGDYVLALGFGIAFQFFAIAPMLGLGLKDGLVAAAKADVISLTCFEIGLFGWMALMSFVFFPAPHHLMPSSPAFWLLMQIGMVAGFASSWPANIWLLKRGIKVEM